MGRAHVPSTLSRGVRTVTVPQSGQAVVGHDGAIDKGVGTVDACGLTRDVTVNHEDQGQGAARGAV